MDLLILLRPSQSVEIESEELIRDLLVKSVLVDSNGVATKDVHLVSIDGRHVAESWRRSTLLIQDTGTGLVPVEGGKTQEVHIIVVNVSLRILSTKDDQEAGVFSDWPAILDVGLELGWVSLDNQVFKAGQLSSGQRLVKR